jgi:hypothetical protein
MRPARGKALAALGYRLSHRPRDSESRLLLGLEREPAGEVKPLGRWVRDDVKRGCAVELRTVFCVTDELQADPSSPCKRFDEKTVDFDRAVGPRKECREPDDGAVSLRHEDASAFQLLGWKSDRIGMRDDRISVFFDGDRCPKL